VAGELLDFSDLMVEEHVGDLVCDVAVGPPEFAEWVTDDDGPACR